MTPTPPSLAALSLLLGLILCSCSLKTDAQSVPPDSGSSICPLEYTEQPPDELLCNPYTNAELRLECTVVAQTQLSQIPKIIWYRSQYNVPQQLPNRQREESQSQSKRNAGGQRITQRLDNTQTGVLIRKQSSTSSNTGFYSVRSRLQLSNLVASDSGEYWCAIELNGQELEVSSDEVFLREPAFYSQISTACSTTGALSKQERKCAVSMASTSTNSVQSTTQGHDAITTAPKSAVEPSQPTATSGSKPTSSSSSSVPNSGVENTNTTTTTSTNDVSSSSTSGDEMMGGSSTDDASNTNTNVLLELYIAVAILVIFGVIIIILVPVTICMCLRKRKNRRVEGMRRARQNLELASARCNIQSTTTQINIASDYLVPLPSWQTQKQHAQLQPVDCHSTDFLHRSYETTLSYSHEYEDVMDVVAMETGNTHHEVYTSGTSPTSISSGVLEEAPPPPPPSMGTYVNDRPVKMKRNAAYRLFSTEEISESVRRHPYCNDVVVPRPMDCLHTQTEQSSNLE